MTLFILLAMGCASERATDISAERTGGENKRSTVDEWIEFTNFDEMVATADSVALVKISAARPSEVRYDFGDTLQATDVDLSLTEQIAGRKVPESVSIRTLRSAYGTRATSFVEWRETGRQLAIFLLYTENKSVWHPESRWRLQNSQGLYLDGDDLQPVAKGDPLAEEVGKWSLAEFRSRVESAVEREQRGEVRPKEDSGDPRKSDPDGNPTR